VASRDIVPTTDAALVAWLQQMASKIDSHAAALALNAAEVSALKADAAMADWTFKVTNSLRAASKQFTAHKAAIIDGQPGGAAQLPPAAPTFPAPPAAVAAGVVLRTRALVQRIKNSPNYTEAFGQDLGIVAPTASTGATPKPTFKAAPQPHSEVRLDWTKGSHSGVIIQGKREGDAEWVELGKDYYSPYVDGRPPVTAGAAEPRQYRMRYLDKDDEVGEWSDVVSAMANP